jgi:hypothetical protein
MQMLEEAKQKLQSTLQDPEQNKTATREYELAVTRVAAAQQAAAGSRPRQTRRRLCRRCGKRFASPEWRPFHEKPYKHSGKDIWEFCTVGESEFEKGFPCFDILLPKRPKEGDETKPSSKMPKPLTLAKPTHVHRTKRNALTHPIPEMDMEYVTVVERTIGPPNGAPIIPKVYPMVILASFTVVKSLDIAPFPKANVSREIQCQRSHVNEKGTMVMTEEMRPVAKNWHLVKRRLAMASLICKSRMQMILWAKVLKPKGL